MMQEGCAMKRLPLLLLLLPALGWAQVPVSANSPTGTRSATTLASPPPPPRPLPAPVQPPAPPQPPVVQPMQSPPVPAPVPRSSGPIPSQGPAPVVAPPPSTAPTKVYDRDGRIIPGVKPAGPGRVFDSRTGRYHDTVPGQVR